MVDKRTYFILQRRATFIEELLCMTTCDYTNEKNQPDIPNIKSIYRDVLNSNKLPFIIISAFVVYVSRNYAKDDYTIIHGYISRGQGTDENETCENELKDSGEILESKTDGNSNPNDSAEVLDDDNDYLPEESEYDPRVDYDTLAWKVFCEANGNDPLVEEMNMMIKKYNQL
ncbi:hypothetical protein GLOIN_2v1766675 [Rhizophagus irregularis DAOM 181602=DAOM 197198]|nr:hypothetical protein GLOIN_2v1766675 [Rhizophagus irregularis DAOM 181602=DAOM 197198]